MNDLFTEDIRKFNSYVAKVAKTSLKIASSILSLFFVIMSIWNLTFESSRDCPGTEFRSVMSKLAIGKKN